MIRYVSSNNSEPVNTISDTPTEKSPELFRKIVSIPRLNQDFCYYLIASIGSDARNAFMAIPDLGRASRTLDPNRRNFQILRSGGFISDQDFRTLSIEDSNFIPLRSPEKASNQELEKVIGNKLRRGFFFSMLKPDLERYQAIVQDPKRIYVTKYVFQFREFPETSLIRLCEAFPNLKHLVVKKDAFGFIKEWEENPSFLRNIEVLEIHFESPEDIEAFGRLLDNSGLDLTSLRELKLKGAISQDQSNEFKRRLNL